VADANDNAPVITTSSSQLIVENSTIVAALTSIDADTVGINPATFSITGGADAARFTIAAGNLSFVTPPDLRNPADADHGNVYIVQVTAFDGLNSTNRTITVIVTDGGNYAPIIIRATTQFVSENTTSVVSLTATDADAAASAAVSITGGVDAAAFSILNGDLVFAAAPDFENPTDSDHNNSYLVQVTASDGVHVSTDALTVNVTNVIETLFSSITATLPSSMDNLTLTGTGNIDGIGTALNNVLTGNSGNNRLTGAAGNDSLFGDLGMDTALFSGARQAYTVAKNGTTVTVSGPDGTDTLRGMEYLQFSDMLVKTHTSGVDFNGNGKDDVLPAQSDYGRARPVANGRRGARCRAVVRQQRELVCGGQPRRLQLRR
jgi:hypothetical protein